MDFDQETVDQLVAGAEAHAQRLAAISAKAVAQSTELRQAVSSGNYERAKQIIEQQSKPDGEGGGSVDPNEDGSSLGGTPE